MCLTAALASASAQITSSDTEGKGGVDIFVSETYFPASDVDVYYQDALLLVGLTKRLDLIAGPGVNLGCPSGKTTQRQWLFEYGFQYKLYERGNWRLLTANVASSPWTNRQTGSHTVFASISVARDFRNHKIAVYGGYGPTFTVGNQSDLLFSSKNSAQNFPLGIMIQPRKGLQLFFELGLRSPVYYSSGVSFNVR